VIEELGLREPLTVERGFLDYRAPGAPAAGSNYSFTTGSLNVPFVKLKAVRASLATDANVANRLLSLDLIPGRTSVAIRHAAMTVVTAGTSAQVFQWDQAHTVSEWNANTPVFVPLGDYLLGPGWTVQLTVDNIQAGDQLSAILFVYELFYADSPSDLPS